MAKNKGLIEAYKSFARQVNLVTPEIYASIALALNKLYGWGYEEIEEVFAESQTIWQESVNDRETMLQKCYEVTGIEVTSRINEEG